MRAATLSPPITPINPEAAVGILLTANANMLAETAYARGARTDAETFMALRRTGMSADDIAIHFPLIMDRLGELHRSICA